MDDDSLSTPDSLDVIYNHTFLQLYKQYYLLLRIS